VLLVAGVLVWQGITAAGNPDPLAATSRGLVGVFDVGVLVFREGLECILVLSAVTASLRGSEQDYQKPIAAGALLAMLATLVTWAIAVGIVNNLSESLPALHVQAATGLLAVIVLLVVMNWFFHKVYWTGWITMHNKRKKNLLEVARDPGSARSRALWGFIILGFTSLYREGFEVVLFLQNYRLRMGGAAVLKGVTVGLTLTAAVALLTFVARRRLPYKRMLVLTGILLGIVLLVMVGEQAQEMQLAHWIHTTPIASLEGVIPGWMGLWFSVFPTVETLVAQLLAATIVIGSYVAAQGRSQSR
jgi:high-affinity iron transporter